MFFFFFFRAHLPIDAYYLCFRDNATTCIISIFFFFFSSLPSTVIIIGFIILIRLYSRVSRGFRNSKRHRHRRRRKRTMRVRRTTWPPRFSLRRVWPTKKSIKKIIISNNNNNIIQQRCPRVGISLTAYTQIRINKKLFLYCYDVVVVNVIKPDPTPLRNWTRFFYFSFEYILRGWLYSHHTDYLIFHFLSGTVHFFKNISGHRVPRPDNDWHEACLKNNEHLKILWVRRGRLSNFF